MTVIPERLRQRAETARNRTPEVKPDVEAKTLERAERLELERIQEIIDRIKCPPYEFELTKGGPASRVVLLQARLWRRDTNTGVEGYGYGGFHAIPVGAPPDAIVKRCFVAARDYAEHEVREAFTYKGRRVLDPHQTIQSLWEISREA